jgi:hypothetical protein
VTPRRYPRRTSVWPWSRLAVHRGRRRTAAWMTANCARQPFLDHRHPGVAAQRDWPEVINCCCCWAGTPSAACRTGIAGMNCSLHCHILVLQRPDADLKSPRSTARPDCRSAAADPQALQGPAGKIAFSIRRRWRFRPPRFANCWPSGALYVSAARQRADYIHAHGLYRAPH